MRDRRLPGRWGVVELLLSSQQLSLTFRLCYKSFKFTGHRWVICMSQNIDPRIAEHFQIGGRVRLPVRPLWKHVSMDAGDDKLTQLQIVRRYVHMVLVIQDIHLHSFVHPDPLYNVWQHPLAVWV